MAPSLTAPRVVVAGMVGGILTLAAIAFLIRSQRGVIDADVGSMLALVAVVVAVTTLGTSSFLLPQMDKVHRQQFAALEVVPEEAWRRALMTRTIMACALLEAPALLALIAYLLGGPDWALALGLMLAAILGGLYFPTDERYRRFLDEQSGALAAEKAAA